MTMTMTVWQYDNNNDDDNDNEKDNNSNNNDDDNNNNNNNNNDDDDDNNRLIDWLVDCLVEYFYKILMYSRFWKNLIKCTYWCSMKM